MKIHGGMLPPLEERLPFSTQTSSPPPPDQILFCHQTASATFPSSSNDVADIPVNNDDEEEEQDKKPRARTRYQQQLEREQPVVAHPLPKTSSYPYLPSAGTFDPVADAAPPPPSASYYDPEISSLESNTSLESDSPLPPAKMRRTHPASEATYPDTLFLDEAELSIDNSSASEKEDDPIHYPVNNMTFYRTFSPGERCLLRLCDLLDSVSAPLYLLDEILKVLHEESSNGTSITDLLLLSRKSFLQSLQKRFKVPRPIATFISLEGISTMDRNYVRGPGESLSVVHYNFLAQMNELLSDFHLFGCTENLRGCMNVDKMGRSRFDPYIPSGQGSVDDVHDGSWYQSTVQSLYDSFGNGNWIVVPVIMYLDKTGTDRMMRYGMEPVMFTTTLLNRSTRNNPQSWKVLGFIPDLDALKSSASKAKIRSKISGKGQQARNYHSCLSVILRDFQRLQGLETPVLGHVRCGDLVQRARLFFPLCFVVGDGKSGDMLCGRKQSYSKNRISRSCNVSFQYSDNENHYCQPIDYSAVHPKCVRYLKLIGKIPWDITGEDNGKVPNSEKEKKREARLIKRELDSISQNPIDNAFSDVWFGSNTYGITAATPTDCMHAFLHGIVEYCAKIYFAGLTDGEKGEIDQLVIQIVANRRSSERNKFPRTSFVKGITNLTLVTADEWPGILLSLAIVAMSDRGNAILMKAVKRRFPDFQENDEQDFFSRGMVFPNPEEPEEIHDTDTQDEDIPASESSVIEGEEDQDEVSVSDDCGDDPEKMMENKVSGRTGGGGENPTPVPVGPVALISLVEMLLTFHSWYKRGAPFDVSTIGKINAIRSGIGKMIRSIKIVIPRTAGNGWKLQKLHDLMHLTGDIVQYGSPQNYDAGTGESGLKAWVKKPARTSQKLHPSDFTEQVNDRLYTTCLIEKAMKHVIHQNPSENEKKSEKEDEFQANQEKITQPTSRCCGQFRYRIYISNESVNTNGCSYRWFSRGRSHKGPRIVHPSVCQFIQSHFRRNGQENLDYVDFFTEYERDGTVFRAHPNYRSKGDWHDYVMVHFDNDEAVTVGCYGTNFYPCKCIAFYISNDEIFAVMHCGAKHYVEYSTNIFERWSFEYKRKRGSNLYEPKYRIVSVDAFAERVLVFDDYPGLTEGLDGTLPGCNMATLVIDRDLFWANKFFQRAIHGESAT